MSAANANKQMESTGQDKDYTKKEKPHHVLSMVQPLKYTFDGQSSKLTDAVTVIIACEKNAYHKQLIFHRPVGKHYLTEDDWVVTPLHEVQTLLAGEKDPTAERRAKILERIIVDEMKAKGALTIKDGEEFIGTHNVTKERARAKAAHAAAADEAYNKYVADFTGKKKPKSRDKWTFGQSPESFWDQEIRTAYLDARKEAKKCEKYTKAVEEAEGYITTYSDGSPQVTAFNNVPTGTVLVDRLKNAIVSFKPGSEAALKPLKTARAETEVFRSQVADLKREVEQLKQQLKEKTSKADA